MRISARCDYACKALLELSLHWPKKGPIQIQAISDSQKVPMRYLVQILIQLKQMGCVTSSRGKDGGYVLAKSPEKILLGEVLRGVGGTLLPIADSAAKNGSVFSSIWKETEKAISNTLDKITFQDIIDKTKDKEKAIIYHI